MAGLTCLEVVGLVTDHLDGNLRWTARRRVEKHLAACPGCTPYVEQMRRTLALLGEVPSPTLSPESQALLLLAFRDVSR